MHKKPGQGSLKDNSNVPSLSQSLSLPATALAPSGSSSCRLQFTTISRRNAQKITWHEQHFSFAWRLRHEILVMIRSTRGHKTRCDQQQEQRQQQLQDVAEEEGEGEGEGKAEGKESWQRSHVALRGSTKFRFRLLSSNRGSDKQARGQLRATCNLRELSTLQ